MLSSTTKKLSGVLDTVKQYAAWISIGAGMFALVGAAYGIQVIQDVRGDVEILEAEVSNLTDRTHAAELQCALLEASVKAAGEKYQFIKWAIDENHPR